MAILSKLRKPFSKPTPGQDFIERERHLGDPNYRKIIDDKKRQLPTPKPTPPYIKPITGKPIYKPVPKPITKPIYKPLPPITTQPKPIYKPTPTPIRKPILPNPIRKPYIKPIS